MHFVSLEWLAWMLGTFSMYWLLPAAWRNWALMLVTLVFLVSVDPISAAHLVAIALLAFVLGREGAARGPRMVAGVLLIGATLAYYKVQVSGAPDDLFHQVVMPLGLSYYSFRCIHYLFEQYRGNVEPHSFGEFLCYLFFLPTIVVGPIHRVGQFLTDLRAKQWNASDLSEGLERILYGYVKIAVLGNFLVSGEFAGWIASLDDASPALVQYLEVVRGGLNIYLQFSGFADVAIGFSLLLGYRIIENFNWPYFQKNIAAFWRCWHISLTSWCRDYVYLPVLGMTRNPILATYSTFMVIGLWHEISLRYVVWALYHASGVLLWRAFQRIKRQLRLPRVKGRAAVAVVDGLSILATVHFVWFGLVIVRQPELAQALEVFRTIFLGWL